MLDLIDRTFEVPGIGAGVKSHDGDTGAGPGVYRYRTAPPNPLRDRWKQWVGEDVLAELSTESLEVTSPIVLKQGRFWPDPRMGTMAAPAVEPWEPDHANVVAGLWRAPNRKLRQDRPVPAGVLKWWTLSYQMFLIRGIIGAPPRRSKPCEAEIRATYNSASKRPYLSIEDLELAYSFKERLLTVRRIWLPSTLLKPHVEERLRSEINPYRGMKLQAGALSNWTIKAMDLSLRKGTAELSGLPKQPRYPQELLGKWVAKMKRASKAGFIFDIRDAGAVLRDLYSLWQFFDFKIRERWNWDLTLVARSIRADSVITQEGFFIIKSIVQKGNIREGAVQHFKTMLEFLEGRMVEVKMALI